MKLRATWRRRDEREVIERQAQHLVRLVDDLLDVSRIARGKVDAAQAAVELASVVAQGGRGDGPLLEQRRHRLRIAVAARRAGRSTRTRSASRRWSATC